MNYIDIIILVVLAIGFILGFKDGIIRKLIGLVGLIVAVIVAFLFANTLGSFLSPFFSNEVGLANAVSGLLIFFIVLSIASLFKRLLHPADKVNRFVNQILGGVFGTLQMAIFLSGFLLFFHIFNFPTDDVRNKSFLYKHVYSIIPTVIDFFVEDPKSTEDYFKEFIQKAEETTNIT